VVHSSSAELRKAAVLLLSLPEDDASALLSKLDKKQVEAVSIEIAKLGHFNQEEQEAVAREFAGANPNVLSGTAGGLKQAKTLVQKALGKNATGTLDNVQQSIEALPFGFLKQVDAQNLLTFIADEHPQTIALILCHLPPSYGAEVIAGLQPKRQISVISRIANMGQTSPEVIEEVEKGLEKRMAAMMNQSYQDAGGVNRVAQILNVTDRATERSILESLGQDDAEIVDQIRRLMFVFPDLVKLSDKDMQAVLKNVENSEWTVALKGVSEEVTQKVFGNLSKRAAAMLEEEMEYLGPVRVSEVEAAQQQIVDVIRRLEDSGEITLQGEEEEEFIQ